MKRFAVSKHVLAPMYEKEGEGQELIREAIQEMRNLGGIEDVRQFVRQTAVVNLWFFEKFIAGFNGPFDEITDHVHLDMANFCQDYAMRPGSFCAMAAPRKHFKSTVATMGFNAWEIVRNPDISIGLYHAVYTEAIDFLHVVQRIFDSNELFAWLFPEYVPAKNAVRWNDKEMMLPGVKEGGPRRRIHKEATLECGSVGGTSQGRHYDKIDLDDIVGENDLNADRKGSVDMYKKKEWIKGIKRTLVKNWKTDRVFAKFTRYAVDDAYEPIMDDVRSMVIYDDHKMDYEVKKDGSWDVYYRFVEENGRIIFPERITREGLDKMIEEDPWSYWTQYENNPQKSGLAEFQGNWVGSCVMDYDDFDGWKIIYNEDRKDVEVLLADCDVVMAIDPASTEKYVSARTSRTALVLVAHASDDKRFVISIRADYVDVPTMYDWMFVDAEKFNGYLRMTALEAQGPYKMLEPLVREEERKRNMYLNLRGVSAIGDKDIRIRNNLMPIAGGRLLYVVEPFRAVFMEEFNGFPQSQRKDVLDATSIAVSHTNRPLSVEEKEAEEEAYEDRVRSRSTNVTGY